MCLVCCGRIHSVQSVINSPTQLSGIGFSCIFCINIFVSNFTFFGAPKWKLGRVCVGFLRLLCNHIFVFYVFFEDQFCTKCNLREFVLTHVILAPGARGRGGPSSGPWRNFRGICGIRGIREIVPNHANSLCFHSKSYSDDTPMQCLFYVFIPL